MSGIGAVGVADYGAIPLSSTEFDWFTGFLRSVTGIELKPGKERLVMSRLERRVRQCGLSSYRDYFTLLGNPDTPHETRLAIDLMTTNETYFFREEQHFELLPDLLPPPAPTNYSAPRPLRIWSAGCSTGEEAYSIALTLANRAPTRPFDILGTDVSTRVLDIARRGLYPVEAAQRIPAPYRGHCRRGRGDYHGLMTFDADLRARVSFKRANFVKTHRDLGQFDIVFLRNVMIYFREDMKRRVIDQIKTTLHPGGYLIIGLAETLTGLGTGLQRCGPSIYRAPNHRPEPPR